MAETSAQLVTYSVTAADIAATKAKYATLEADSADGYEEVRLAIAHVRDTRVSVEKRRVELKADALAYGRLVDSEAKRFTSLLLEIEEPLKAKKAAVDDEKARVKAEAEAVKLRALEAEIAANRARQEAEAQAIREAEEKRLAEERAAIEAERAEMARERAALEAERAKDEAWAAASREKLAEERRAEDERQRAEREAINAEREATRRAEFERNARIAAEKEAVEKVEHDRLVKVKNDAELAALLPDAEKVTAFVAEIRALTAPKVRSAKASKLLVEALNALALVADELAKGVAGWKR